MDTSLIDAWASHRFVKKDGRVPTRPPGRNPEEVFKNRNGFVVDVEARAPAPPSGMRRSG